MELLYDSQKQENIEELKNWFISEELFLCEKLSHPGEASHLSEISAEWYILLCKNKLFM